jgi:hypothetical protein
MAHRSASSLLPIGFFYAGLALLIMGLLPVLRREAEATHAVLAVAGACLIALGIVIGIRLSRRSVPTPGPTDRPSKG